jgi:hypothetical protein
MNTNQRNLVYLALGILNAALLAADQQGAVPAQYAHYAALASFLLAALLKEFGAKDADPPAAPPTDTVIKGFEK